MKRMRIEGEKNKICACVRNDQNILTNTTS